MPALLIRMSIEPFGLRKVVIWVAASRTDPRSESSTGTNLVLMLGAIDEIWSITGWTLLAVRARRTRVAGGGWDLAKVRAVCAPRPPWEVPVMTIVLLARL